jgi:hypothetical protein
MTKTRTHTNTTMLRIGQLFQAHDPTQLFDIVTNGYARGKTLTRIREDLEAYTRQPIKPCYFRTLIEMWYPETFDMGLVERRKWFMQNFPVLKMQENRWSKLYDPTHPVYKHFTSLNLRNYHAQKSMALKRQIPFEFDFLGWIVWWISTSHIHERGVLNINYQMCRIGDTGPYSWDNVYCATGEQNKADYWGKNKPGV